MREKTTIISAFSCLGKTYLGNKYENILDLEASHDKWIYHDKELAKDVEKRKGVTNRILNPEYPENYIRKIIENLNKYDVILITPEKRIRQILKEKKLDYIIAWPVKSNFVSKRSLERGNNTYFAEGLAKSWNTWYPEEDEKVLWVSEKEYLEDVLLKNRIISL